MSKLRTNEIEPFSSTGVAIGGPPTSNPSAILDVQSTTQGMLTPRMTTAQRNAIPSPVEGLLIYNLDDGRLEQYTSGQWTVVGNGLTPIKNVLRVIKNTVLNAGDFSTIAAALAYAVTLIPSPSNQVVIEVGPGVFVEAAIHMVPYVYIRGQDFDSTVIQAVDPTDHLIYGSDFSSISECLLTGVTLAGKALVYYASTTGTPQTAFWADNIRFGSSDTLAIADGTLAHTNLFIFDCRFGGVYQFNTGFVAKTPTNTYFGRIICFNSTSSKMTAPYPADMFVCDGPGSELYLKSIAARTGVTAGGGNGLRVRNGGMVRATSIDLIGWSKGMWIENVGVTSPFLILGILTFTDNTQDVQIDHPSVTGGMAIGANDDVKVYINPANTDFGFTILGLEDGDIVVSGSIKQNQIDGTFTDISTLTRNSSALGILVSGDINPPGSPTSFTVTVEAGMGYLQKSDGSLRKIIWPNTPVTLPPSATSYLYFDLNGTLQTANSLPNTIQNVFIGRVVTHATGIELVEESGFQATHMANSLSMALKNGIGVAYSSGSIVSEVGTRNLNITAGSYYLAELNFLLNGANPTTWVSFYQNGAGGFTRVPSQTVVDNAFWDNGTGTLSPIGAGNYVKHSIYALGDSTNDFDSEAYFLVYSQAQYTALTLAEQGALPNPPNFLSDAVTVIASIIVQQGTANIVEIRDERPIIGSGRVSNVAASTFHHNLLGLNDFDDHLRYLPVDGSRPMTGDLPMGTHNVTNAGTYNGVVVENHHARHQPGSGLDELPTAAAVTQTPNQSNATGTSTSLSRADHVHNVPTAAPVSQTPNNANADGSAANFSRSDHIHNIPTVAPANQTIAASASDGSAATFSRSDHLHTFSTAAAVTQNPDQANAAGTSTSFSRADHIHNVPTATAVSVGTSNAQGSSTSFSRADHVHQGVHSVRVDSGTQEFGDLTLLPGNGTTVIDSPAGTFTFDTIGGPNELAVTNGGGLVANYTTGKVRYDGVFTQVAAGSITLTASITNGRIYVDVDGTVKQTGTNTLAPAYTTVLALFTTDLSTITSLADHRTFLNQNLIRGLVGDIVTILPDAVTAAGTTDRLADAGHTHAIATAAASTQTPNQANAKGSSTSFSRADHIHNIPTGTPSSLTPNASNSQGSAAAFAQQDHIHNIPTAAPITQGPDNANADGSAATFSRSDHIHNIPTAIAVTESANANVKGTSTSFSRADHTHQLTAGTASQDHEPQYDGSNWQAVYPEQALNPSRAWQRFDEFISFQSGTTSVGELGWVPVVTGGASTVTQASTLVSSNHPGVVTLTGGNAANRSAAIILSNNDQIILGGGAMSVEYEIYIPTLATAAQDYSIRVGLGDTTAGDFNNGVYFEYTRGTSTNWLIKTANGGTRSSTTTSTAVAAGVWIKLTIQINAAASSVTYLVNGTSVGTITTNIPTANAVAFATSITMITAPASSTYSIDYFNTFQRFTTAR